VALWSSVSVWGEATPSGETPVVKPGVTVERQGRLLVFRYGATREAAQNDPNRPPAFAVYQGQRKIASGQFEYG
jgi:hypothetical protein